MLVSRLIAIEQQHAELLFQIRDRIADRRCRPSEPTARRRETSRFDHREEHGELIDAGHAPVAAFQFP